MARSSESCISVDCVRAVLGIRMAWTRMSSSLSVGANSCPRRENSRSEPRNKVAAIETTTPRHLKAVASDGS